VCAVIFCGVLLVLQENPQILLNLAESNMEDSAEYGEVTCERCTCRPSLFALFVCFWGCTKAWLASRLGALVWCHLLA
jgi:hypothetical protein